MGNSGVFLYCVRLVEARRVARKIGQPGSNEDDQAGERQRREDDDRVPAGYHQRGNDRSHELLPHQPRLDCKAILIESPSLTSRITTTRKWWTIPKNTSLTTTKWASTSSATKTSSFTSRTSNSSTKSKCSPSTPSSSSTPPYYRAKATKCHSKPSRSTTTTPNSTSRKKSPARMFPSTIPSSTGFSNKSKSTLSRTRMHK